MRRQLALAAWLAFLIAAIASGINAPPLAAAWAFASVALFRLAARTPVAS